MSTKKKNAFDVDQYWKRITDGAKMDSDVDEEMQQIFQEFERSVDNMGEEEKEKLRQVFVKCDEDAKADRAHQKRKSKKKINTEIFPLR